MDYKLKRHAEADASRKGKQDNVAICRIYMPEGATRAHMMVIRSGFRSGWRIVHLDPSRNAFAVDMKWLFHSHLFGEVASLDTSLISSRYQRTSLPVELHTKPDRRPLVSFGRRTGGERKHWPT